MTKPETPSASIQSCSPTSLQYTVKGFLPMSPPLSPTAVSASIQPFSASSTYALAGTEAKKKEEEMIATTFPASAISESANQPQRSLTFPISHSASGATKASAREPISPKRSKTLQANSPKAGNISLKSWELRAGIVEEDNMVKFPEFREREEK